MEHIAHRDPLVYYRILALYPKSSGARIRCATIKAQLYKRGRKEAQKAQNKSGDAVKHRPTG